MGTTGKTSAYRYAFGDRLREVQTQDLRLESKELAAGWGVKESELSDYKNGVHCPGLETLADLGTAFPAVDLTFLVTGHRRRTTPGFADVIAHELREAGLSIAGCKTDEEELAVARANHVKFALHTEVHGLASAKAKYRTTIGIGDVVVLGPDVLEALNRIAPNS